METHLNQEKIKKYIDRSGCRCPFCGSANLNIGDPQSSIKMVLINVSCNDCRKGWQDVFKMSGIEYGGDFFMLDGPVSQIQASKKTVAPKRSKKRPFRRTCIICGEVKEVSWSCDPYVSELYDKVEKRGWWCQDCHQNCADEI